jgi:hypothetical protein
MDIDDDDRPTAMTHDQLSRLFDIIRDPSIMRQMFRYPLHEQLHELLLAEHKRTPDVKIPYPHFHVENYIIGLLTALRPLMTSMVDAFFELPPAEHTRREELLAEDEQAERDFWREEDDPDDECSKEPTPYDTVMDNAYRALDAAVSKLSTDERKRLAYDFVTKPEAMIRNVMAAEVFRRVLALTHIVEQWTRDQMSAYVAALNDHQHLLPFLRDLRRSLG